jgi:hypothetical protein
VIGYNLKSSYNSISKGFSDAGYVIGVLAVLAIAFLVYHRYRSYKAATAPGGVAHRAAASRPSNRPLDPAAAEEEPVIRRQP